MSDQPQGILSINPRGFGFVRLSDDENSADREPHTELSAFVAPPDLAGLLDGDLVSGEMVEDRAGYRMRKLSLIERHRTQLFGEVVMQDGKRMLSVDPEVSNEQLAAARCPTACRRKLGYGQR